MPKPIVLMILDGFGYRENTSDNAITQANTPHFDQYWKEYTHTLISASSHDVGLPEGQMGNSEVGHTNLGAGRVVFQDLTRVDNAISDGSFFENAVLTEAVDGANAVHVMGLLSPGGVHSHEDQIEAMLKLAIDRGAKKVYFHAFLDGRDTPPKSAEPSLAKVDKQLKSAGVGYVASVVGRYYAMDRDNRWERVSEAYNLLTHGKADHRAQDAVSALHDAYAREENDEFVRATAICPDGAEPVCVQDGDSVIFMNFRADRAREISHAFADDAFDHFDRGSKLNLSAFVSLTEYEAGLNAKVAYPPEALKNVLGEYLADLGLKQLRIAETEKYAHVTFFFNGGKETPFEGEDRILVPSPKVPTYDLQPEMSAPEVTDKLVEAIESGKYDVIICNYANPDMVGHTGNLEAAIKAIEVVDECVSRVVEATVSAGGEALITADHGNAEQMYNEKTGQAHTAHTNLPVPLFLIGRPLKVVNEHGKLSDIAPTILSLMDIPQPPEMTGKAIFK